MLAREAKSPKAFGTSGRVVPKRSAGSSVRPVTIAEPSLGEGAKTSGPASVDEEMVQEAEELKPVSAPILPSKAEVESHNVSHLPFRSWCSACVRGPGLYWVIAESTRRRRRQSRYRPSLWITASLGNPEDRAHDTLPVLIVRDRKRTGIWSHAEPWKGVTHPYPARALMADLDFMAYRRVILKSDQGPSIVALCDAVKNGWHGEIVPEASPEGESKRNGEVERAVQSVPGLARTLKDFLGQKSGIALESRSPLLAWLVEHCSNLLLLFHKRRAARQSHCLHAFERQALEN